MPDQLPVPIIRSKLYPPPIAADAVIRERLLKLASDVAVCPATLVSAPAGYGKSTLVSHWLARLTDNAAWLSLDSADSNLRRFVSYVVAALRTALPDCCGETIRSLHAQELPRPEELAGILCNDFDSLNTSAVLVLDDYYQINAADVHEFVDTLLRRPPRGLHVVIVTRRDPPLALQSLRANGALTEVRMRHLAFNEAETLEFMHSKYGDSIADHAITRLHERTEGWPVGLRLAAIALPDLDSASEFIDRIPSDIRSVRGYLIQEVVAKCPPTIRDYLLRTSLVDRFSARLCEAVFEQADATDSAISGSNFIHWLEDAGLFVIALDERHEWFRYHHLFQSMLQEQASATLSRGDIRDINLRAAGWFEANGLFEEAMRHLLAADDTFGAAELVIRHRNQIMNNEQWHRLATWLGQLPAGMVESRPELLLLKARLHRTRGSREEFAEALVAAEALLETGDVEPELRRDLLGSLESSRCFALYVQCDGEGAVAAARLALDVLPEDSLAERGFAMVILGGAMQMTGAAVGALEMLYAAMPDESSPSNHPTYVTRLLVALCFVQWMEADLGTLQGSADEAAARSDAAGLYEARTIAVHFQAAIDYQQNRLHDVIDRLHDIARSDVVISAEFHAQSMIAAALAHHALGDRQAAAQIARLLRDLAFKSRNTYLVQLAEAFEAELAFRDGRLVQALEWAERFDPEPLTPIYSSFSPVMVLAKILVVADTPPSRRRATVFLDHLVNHLTAIHNKRFLAEALALRAMLRDATGQSGFAMTDLAQALRLALPGRFIRLFVDLGVNLGVLLSRLDLDEEGLAYVGEILAAFRQSTPDPNGSNVIAGTGQPGIEPLSPRELQILRLLADRLSNREIADRLHISTVTVKRHAANIYQKLGVHGRRQAVAKASGLGVLGRSARP